ncbi:lipid A-modifier LpxR family protein [Kangsaoukella pontilimi]
MRLKGLCPSAPSGPHPRIFRTQRNAVCSLLAALCLGSPAMAETIGWSVAISNDSIGEARDRWQSSSVQVGIARGRGWDGQMPDRVGEVLEFRFRSDILTPEVLDAPAPGDRRHAGVLAIGLHSHFARSAWEARLGADVVVVGPQTGLLSFQEQLHEALGFTVPRLDDYQIEDQVGLDLSGEVGRALPVGAGVLRPFVEAQVGSEDLLRVGLDLSFGALASGNLMTRAVTTGHRLPMTFEGGEGMSWTLGVDTAWVEDSIYLPEALGYDLTPTRTRVRAGGLYRWRTLDVFYGLAWLSEEFEAQPEGQFVGTFQARIDF